MLKYDYPFIVNVSYLKGYDLLIDFSDGSSRIVDMSDSFEIPAALKYSPIEVFKNFGFDKHAVWWGDRDSSDSMEVGADSLHGKSVEVSEYMSNLYTQIQSLSYNSRKLL